MKNPQKYQLRTLKMSNSLCDLSDKDMKEYINMVLSNSLRPKASQTYIDAYKEYKDSGGE